MPAMSFQSPDSRKRLRMAEEESALFVRKREIEEILGPNPYSGSVLGRLRSRATAQKDIEFWFEDGTLLIVAQNIEFRVYNGLLTDGSVVFKQLLSQPHTHHTLSIGDQQTIRCPVVVHVTDSPQDMRNLFRALMPRGGRRFVTMLCYDTSRQTNRCPPQLQYWGDV